MEEYLIVSRGGQGGVTASRILATAAVIEGKYAQAIPQFGAERRGAIVRSYLRVSTEPIRRHCQVQNPSGVAVFSSRILDLVDPKSFNAVEGAKMVINSAKPRKVEGFRVFYVDATKIALDLGLVIAGWAVVNTAMAGAMARVFGISSLDSLLKAMEEYFRGRLLELNQEAARRAWNQVSEVG